MSRTVQIQSIALCENQVPRPLGLSEAIGISGSSPGEGWSVGICSAAPAALSAAPMFPALPPVPSALSEAIGVVRGTCSGFPG